MQKLKFQKLTPTQDVDLSGYEEALEYVFSESDIRNIAISGSYSAGKSSIIESYKRKHPDKNFMHLSLAHFRPADSETSETIEDGENSCVMKDQKMTESDIEGKILNQLIQQIPSKKIPQTNFRIKQNVGVGKVMAITFLTCVFILCMIHCIKFYGLKEYIANLDDGIFKEVFSIMTNLKIRIITGIIAFAIFGVAIYKFIRVQCSKNILRKINLQGNEIEIFSDSNDSYFDKYLNEVLYLFENTGVDGIVFEDIDRFDNVTIFERLREINTLTNIRLRGNGKEKNKTLRFFYLLRDDIFENKDRTKFFDYILPVVPVLDSSNSYNKLKEYLENVDLYVKFDDHFLRGISLYIDDLRVLKNIFNEFIIYNKRLNNIELDVNKMFAIITYKNIFPRDFADLQLNRGFVYALFASKGELIENQSAALKQEYEKIIERIQNCEKERLDSLQELEDVKSARYNWIYNSNKKYTSRENDKWQMKEYPRRKQAIEDSTTGKIANLRERQDVLKKQIQNIKNLSLSKLLTREVVEDAFKIEYVNETGERNNFYAIKGNYYFDLLKYLITRGYIDESYSDYMTYFYSNSLSIGDKMFLRSVLGKKEKPFEYQLDAPELVVENLEEFDFTQPETLNFDLTEYILAEAKPNLVSSMINQLKEEKRFDYIDGYMRSEKDISKMVMAINQEWPSMFFQALTEHLLQDNLIKKFSYKTVEYADVKTLGNVNVEECLTSYISQDKNYLSVGDIDIQNCIKSFGILGVSFKEINAESVNEVLLEEVYQKNLYEINDSNIRLMLVKKCGVSNIEKTMHAFITFIITRKELPLCKHLWSNIKDTFTEYLKICNENISDSSDAIIAILNNAEVSLEDKKIYIERLVTFVHELAQISEASVQTFLVENLAIMYTVGNILYYYEHNGLSSELVSFINSNNESLDYTEMEKDGVTDKFLDSCLRCNEIDNEKYKQIIANLCTPMSEFDIEGLSDEKIVILIDLNFIPMNKQNLGFIRREYADNVYKYIHYDIDTYIDVVEEAGVEPNEIVEILTWCDVPDEKKINLLSKTESEVTVKERDFSDEVVAYVLDHNLKLTDILWLIETYGKKSDRIKKSILTVCQENMPFVISNSANMDNELLNQIMADERVDFECKIDLLKKVIGRLSEDDIWRILLKLGAEKIVDNLNGGHKRVEVSSQNELILNTLCDAGIIENYETFANEKYYKKIRKTENDK